MFERFTNSARRSIFFARYEAQAAGAPNIEPAHLVLGAMREVPDVFRELMAGDDRFNELAESLRKHHAVTTKASAAADMPLSEEAKYALGRAAELAPESWVAAEALLTALVEAPSVRATLKPFGITPDALGEYMKSHPAEPYVHRPSAGVGGRLPGIRMTPSVSGSARVTSLLALSGRIPPERREAAERILRGLCDDRLEISGTDSQGDFRFNFGKPEGS